MEESLMALDAPGDPEAETIDYSLVYALHTFVANLEGQVCVLKGDSLELLDDSNSYWWLVKCIKTDEIGYIPAENVETPFERLARLNKMKNVQLVLINAQDEEDGGKAPDQARKGITFNEVPDVFENYDEDYDLGEDEEYDENADEAGEQEEGDADQRANGAGKSSSSANSPSDSNGKIARRLLGRSSTKEKEKDKVPQVQSTSPTSSASNVAARTPSVGIKSKVSPEQQQQVVSSSPKQDGMSGESPKDQAPINVLRIYAGNVDLKATFKTVPISVDMTTGQLLDVTIKRFRIPNATPNEYYLSVLHMDSQEKRLDDEERVMGVLDNLRQKQLPGFTKTTANNNSLGRINAMHMSDEKIIKVLINKKLNLFEKNYHLIRVFMYDEADPQGRSRTYKTIGVNSEATIKDITETAIKKFKLGPPPNTRYYLCSVFKGYETPRQDNENIYGILTQAAGTSEEIDFVLRKESLAPVSAAYSQMGTTSPMQSDQAPPQTPPQSVNPGMSPNAKSMSTVPAVATSPGEWNQSSMERSATTSSPWNTPPRTAPSPNTTAEINGVKYIAGQIVPPRKGSLVDLNGLTDAILSGRDVPLPGVILLNREQLAANRVGEPVNSSNAKPLDMNKPLVDIPASDTTTKPDQPTAAPSVSPSESQQPGTPMSANGAMSTSIKTNFEYMEEYLEEIMKESIDPAKLEQLENMLKKSDTSPPAARRSMQLQPSQLRKYSDSGLSEIMKNSGSLPRPASLARPLMTADSTRDRSVSNVSLKDLYDDIERDLDKSLQTATTTPGSQVSPPSMTGLSSSSYFFAAPSVASQESFEPSSVQGRGIADSYMKELPIPLPEKDGEVNLEKALEQAKEIEHWLNNMQHDLDKLLAKAITVFR
ncbi:hypothetical protein HDV05_007628 [Chytridiales sp. JEL 0842]|nr:hypothetical protein HDV05_007628 [Chytridiales sp. JEL 0842]